MNKTFLSLILAGLAVTVTLVFTKKETADKIAQSATLGGGENSRPVNPVVIKSVKIVSEGR